MKCTFSYRYLKYTHLSLSTNTLVTVLDQFHRFISNKYVLKVIILNRQTKGSLVFEQAFGEFQFLRKKHFFNNYRVVKGNLNRLYLVDILSTDTTPISVSKYVTMVTRQYSMKHELNQAKLHTAYLRICRVIQVCVTLYFPSNKNFISIFDLHI